MSRKSTKESVEIHTRRMYDEFGSEYQKRRDEKDITKIYNEFLEVPCMIKAVGNVKGKKLLDVGCGAGVHAKAYVKKGAKVQGIDISNTMIMLARERCKGVDFKVGSMNKLPYASSSFDIVTASLVTDYIKDLKKAFLEVNRVLKKGGLLYTSDNHPIACAREFYENDYLKIRALGYVMDKKTGKRINLGRNWLEGIDEFEMVPGMMLKTYKRTFHTYLKAIRDAGFELIDYIDCKPIPEFKKYDPDAYELFCKIPIFGIAVCRKK
ncbi:class I SAM-dependent methyltransferase [Candidatus Woesearchaeota archaeon]|nr:class I SAM-dependent methyltransferase [Candidatus Woesearchaeota archaeon]